MIWDVFMLRDELDMLECRLMEFEHCAGVHHVIVESALTHRGDGKPLHFRENADRFARWSSRFTYVLGGLPVSGSAWAREHIQRDIAMGSMNPGPEDIILISDVDEFPSAEFMDSGLPNAQCPKVTLNQKLNMYAVDWEVPVEWACEVAVTGAALQGDSLSHLRDNRMSYPMFNGGGRHLTWLGGQEAQARKLAVTCHEEMDGYERARISSGECYRTGIHHAGDLQLLAVDVDGSWPRYIYERKCPESWFRPR
jgi:Glycosyltransferase family 17